MQILKTDRLVIANLNRLMVSHKLYDPEVWLASVIEINEVVTVESWCFEKCTGDIVVTSLYPVCFEEMEALAEHIIYEYDRIEVFKK